MPFLRSSDPMKFWNSRDCREVEIMGYTYEDINLKDADLIQDIKNKYLWTTDPLGRPSPRKVTKFPVDFGASNSKAPCLPPDRVYLDSDNPFPKPYIRDPRGGVIRAIRSINPDQSGVEPGLRQSVNGPGADSNEWVSEDSSIALINTNSIREWDISVKFEK